MDMCFYHGLMDWWKNTLSSMMITRCSKKSLDVLCCRFSGKTYVYNMRGAQVDYHGTMAVPNLGGQSNGFDWILGSPKTQWSIMMYHHVSQSSYNFSLDWVGEKVKGNQSSACMWTDIIKKKTYHIPSQDSQLLLSNLWKEVIHIITRFEHNAWDELWRGIGQHNDSCTKSATPKENGFSR